MSGLGFAGAGPLMLAELISMQSPLSAVGIVLRHVLYLKDYVLRSLLDRYHSPTLR